MSEERFARVGELELCWQQFGRDLTRRRRRREKQVEDVSEDPPLLMIMGLGAQMILWPEELCELIAAEGYRVIRFDNRDSGRSTKLGDAVRGSIQDALAGKIPEGAYTLSDMADDAAGLLDALEIEAAHVVGASLGGMIAQTLAIERPERVLSLASLMSTTGHPEVGRPTPRGLAGLTTVPPRDRDGYVLALVEARRLIGSPGFPFDEERSARTARSGFDRGYFPEGTVRQTIAILASGDRTATLGDISAPTVVIHGEDDPLIDVSGGKATAEAIPGAKLMLIPGMGHDFPAGVWEDVAAAIAENARRA